MKLNPLTWRESNTLVKLNRSANKKVGLVIAGTLNNIIWDCAHRETLCGVVIWGSLSYIKGLRKKTPGATTDKFTLYCGTKCDTFKLPKRVPTQVGHIGNHRDASTKMGGGQMPQMASSIGLNTMSFVFLDALHNTVSATQADHCVRWGSVSSLKDREWNSSLDENQ